MEQQNLNDAGWIRIGFMFGIGFGLAGLIFAAIVALAIYLHGHPGGQPAVPAPEVVAHPPRPVAAPAPALPAPLPPAKPRDRGEHIQIPPKDGKTCLQEAHGLIDRTYEACLKGSDYWTKDPAPDPSGEADAQELQQVQQEWAVQLTTAITQAWTVPPGTEPGFKALVSLTLSPAGEVQSALIADGSGVAAFDDSLLKAAYKASPLPLPGRPEAFAPSITICFSPDAKNCQ